MTAAAGDAARQVRSQPSLNTRGLAGRGQTLSGGRDTQQFFPTAEFGYIDVVPAFATFTDRLDVYVDDLKLELHYVGPAHTTNDAVVWIPERRLMFTGDIAFNGGTPFIVQGSLAGHIAACEPVREFGAERIVPGPRPRLRTRGAGRHLRRFAEMIEFNSGPIRCFA